MTTPLSEEQASAVNDQLDIIWKKFESKRNTFEHKRQRRIHRMYFFIILTQVFTFALGSAHSYKYHHDYTIIFNFVGLAASLALAVIFGIEMRSQFKQPRGPEADYK